jgi:hypothetical protein
MCRRPVVTSMTAMALLLSGLVPVLGQTAAERAAPSWTAPRTAWGDPDLEGVFTNSDESLTPFERPADLSRRELRTRVHPQGSTGRRAGELFGDGWTVIRLQTHPRGRFDAQWAT